MRKKHDDEQRSLKYEARKTIDSQNQNIKELLEQKN